MKVWDTGKEKVDQEISDLETRLAELRGQSPKKEDGADTSDDGADTANDTATEGETVKKWYCDHCGKRYDQPGICTDGHADQPVELQEVDDPVNPQTDETDTPEPTDEEKAQALAEQGKDAVIANLKAHTADLENQVAQSRSYAAELEQKIAEHEQTHNEGQ